MPFLGGLGSATPVEDVSGFRAVVRLATQALVADPLAAAPDVVDGVALAVGDRIIMPQLSPLSGIYEVLVVGTGADGQWVRAEDFDTNAEAEGTALVYVQEGATDADVLYQLLTDPPITLGTTPLSWARRELVSGADGSAAPLFGSGSVGSTTTDRYLAPGYDAGLAQTVPIQWAVPRIGVLRNLRIVHNTPAGNGSNIVYTLRVGGVATGLAATVASTAAGGSDLATVVPVLAGDLIDIEVTKAAGIAVSPSDITASLEYAV